MKLIIEDDEGHKTVVPVVRDEITIGRTDGNTVRLTEKNVSRTHGRLLREEGHFYIEDLNSFTGIRVNGEKIRGRHAVQEGDLIQIGEYDLSLSPEDAPEETTESPAPEPEPQQPPPPPPIDPEAEARERKMAETATIRLSNLRTPPGDGPAQDVPEQHRPRLVGISGTYRTKVLVLDRTPIRLGRSDENDVSIDHPSISRKHLRLHLDNGTWKVMDAESRNGVRVNGEPYASIGLRHGDVLEIGHLRFAFVEQGKAFKLPAEFTPLHAGPPAQPRGRAGLYLAAFGAVVLAVGGGAFFALRNRGSADDEPLPASRAERKFALRAADEAIADHRYTEALRNLDIARRAGASAELAGYAPVQGEARSEDLFRAMESAASSQDWERARKLLGVLATAKTWYGQKAAEKADAITAGYVNLHIAAAGLMKDKDNAGCVAEAQLALAANPASADAQSLLEACKKPAIATASVSARPARSAAASRPSASVARAAAGDAEASRLVDEANAKIMTQQDFGGAVGLLDKALALKPSKAVLSNVYRSMGIAYTRQGNMEDGARYYKLYLPLCTDAAEKAQLQQVLASYEARRRQR